MTVKNQFVKLKDNWLIVLIVIIILGMVMFGGNLSNIASTLTYQKSYTEGIVDTQSIRAGGYSGGYYGQENFAPEVKDRLITKTANLNTEVERGNFKNAEARLKSIITTSDSYLLNENVNKYETGIRSYYHGNYQIKVRSDKYDSMITQLKEIGEIKSFSENALDITGRHTDLQVELNTEKQRLIRYQEMYIQATDVKDKIDLSDRIFNQERTIQYLEEALRNIDQRIDYSTVYVTINEKRSEYANIVFVKLSQLVTSFVGSVNGLLKLVVVLIPWIVAVLIIVVIVRLFRRRNQ